MLNNVLHEGEYLSFKVIRIISINDESFYVVESPYKTRHMLDAEKYKNYNLFPDSNITCRVDKINCSGKIFLEPLNPYYKEYQEYDFVITSINVVYGRAGQKLSVATLLGENGFFAKMPLKRVDNYYINQKISAVVIQIKQANILVFDKSDTTKQFSKLNDTIDVRVDKIDNENESKYVLSDIKRNLHIVKYENYKSYNLSVGKNIKAKIKGFYYDGSYSLEPEHPYFRENQKQYFVFVKKTRIYKNNTHWHNEIVVKDDKGLQWNVAPYTEDLVDAFENGITLFKIEQIRKGLLIISPIL